MLLSTLYRFRACLLAVGLGCLLCLPSPVEGQESGTPTLETRVFDIRSLLLEVPDYRAIFSDLRSDDLYNENPDRSESPFVASESKEKKDSEPNRQKKNAELLKGMIMEIIATNTWREHGGVYGVVRFYTGQLVVTNTPEITAEVERLLDLLKASRSLRLRLEACFVLMPSAARERAELGKLLESKDFSAEEFRKLLGDRSEALDVIRASLSGFEGQRVYTAAGRQHNVTVGAQPVVDEGSIGYQPLVRQVMSGVTLEAQSVSDQGQDTVLVDLRASLGHLQLPSDQMTAPPESLAVSASVPPFQVAHFATSLSLPIDRFSLIGTVRFDEEQDVALFVMPSRE